MACGLEEADHCSSLFSSCSTLSSVLVDYNGVWIERDQNCFLFPLNLLCLIPSFAMMIGSKTRLSFLVGEA